MNKKRRNHSLEFKSEVTLSTVFILRHTCASWHRQAVTILSRYESGDAVESDKA